MPGSRRARRNSFGDNCCFRWGSFSQHERSLKHGGHPVSVRLGARVNHTERALTLTHSLTNPRDIIQSNSVINRVVRPLASAPQVHNHKTQRARIDITKATRVAAPGLPANDAGTAHLSVTDGQGGAVGITESDLIFIATCYLKCH